MMGQVVGSYRIARPLGEGGMGAVYLAEHALLGRRAAIKVLLPELSRRQDIVARFFNEARAATSIADPGIVQIFDFGFHTDGSAYIVMELLEGEPLDQRLRRRDRLPLPDALRIARQLATTLAAAHAKGIVHRDLKPENVFLVPDGEVAGGERAKILDFGIAKLAGSESSLAKTQTGAIMGTPLYMSPEQCRGAGDVDQRADIYALGCVLYHLLIGRPPFTSEGAGELLAMHLREAPVPPSAYLPELGPSVDAVVLRCLAKAPADRYASMTEVAGALDQLAIGAGAAASSTVLAAAYVSGTEPARTPTTLGAAAAAVTAPTGARGSWVGWLAAGMVVVLIGSAGVWWSRRSASGGLERSAATGPDDGVAASGAGRAVGASAGTVVMDAGLGDVPADAAVGFAIATEPAPAPAPAAAEPAPAAPTSAERAHDRRRQRRQRRTPPPAPTPPAPSVPVAPSPSCPLDPNGVPLERC